MNRFLWPAAATFVLVSLMPRVALANVGSPLLWLTWFHLVIGNLFLGILESTFLARYLRVGTPRAICVMILANYVSCAIGVLMVPRMGHIAMHVVGVESFFYWLGSYLLAVLMATFVAAVLIEWPFCLWLIRGRTKAGRRSIGATFRVHLISYSMLVLLYFLPSETTILTSVDRDSDLLTSCPDTVGVIYVSYEDDDVYYVALDGSRRQRLSTNEGYGELSSEFDVVTEEHRVFVGKGEAKRVVLAVPASAGRVSLVRQWETSDLRSEADRNWTIRTEIWPRNGLVAIRGEDRVKIGLEVPTMAWWGAWDAIALPSELVVYQFGECIVVVDLKKRKMGFLAHGRSPVAVVWQEKAGMDIRQ